MGHSARSRDIERIAERRYGVVTLPELRQLGVDDSGVRSRLRSGRLHRIHPGVYAVGRRELSQLGLWIAATASYPGGLLSHRSAAELWKLLPDRAGPIHVAVSGTGGKRHRRGVRVHRLISLEPSHATKQRGIPVTTVARTLHDLRRSVSPRDLRRARRQAEYLGFEVIRPADDDGSASRAEAAFLRFCRRSSLPLPEVNARVGPFVADFLWREKNLIVEMDAFATHGGTTSFAEDRRRDLELRGMGFEVLRLTAEQVASEPRQVAMTLRARLT